jgi:DNA-directed RNA polymerase subunit RPC12/RpoP
LLIPTSIRVDTSMGEQDVDYRCSRCGLVALASVTVTGTGLELSGVSLSNALLDARVSATNATQLAPCPRCGHRGRMALLKVLLLGALFGVMVAMAAGFAAADQLHGVAPGGGVDPGGDVGLQVGLAAFLAVVAAVTAFKLRSARRRVRFQRVMR